MNKIAPQGNGSLNTRIAALSPQKQELLKKLLQDKGQADARPTAIRPSPRNGDLPVSFAQQRLWFLDQIAPGSSNFNLNSVIHMKFGLNAGVLERALNELLRRHESLRTRFGSVNGQPVQLIAAQQQLELGREDLRGLAEAERGKRARALAEEMGRRAFDLSRGPLVRAAVVQLGEQDYLFMLTLHHIISDGWSMGILWRELNELYGALVAGRAVGLAELPIQYADYAVWQREYLSGAVLEEQLGYWREQLRELSVLELPTDRERPGVQSFHGAYLEVKLAEQLSEQLRELSRREGVTLFMTLLAGWKVLLARYCNQTDIVVGSYTAGRNRSELEGLIGFFVNTLVLRTDLSGDPSFKELLQRVRKTTLEAYAHEDVPFAKLVDEIQTQRNLSRNPLFQVVFHLFNIPVTADQRTAQEEAQWKTEKQTANFDLVLTLGESTKEISGGIEYSTDLFDEQTIERMAAHYQRLLESILENPEKKISTLPLLGETERQQLLLNWNQTTHHYALHPNLTQLFEAQVAQHPDAIAFTCGDQKVTYQELNKRANQLAHRLSSLQVGPEVPVGIYVERSLDFVVGLIAIWKAGGVYVPLDPNYPRERIKHIIDDAHISLVLTRQHLTATWPEDSTRFFRFDKDQGLISQLPESNFQSTVTPDHLAYMIYTSGSTGRPKGVALEHRQILNRLAWMWHEYPFAPHEVNGQKTAINFVDSIWEFLSGLLQGVPTVIYPDDVVKEPFRLVQSLAADGVTRLWVVPSLLRIFLDTYSDLDERLPLLKFWVTSGEAISSDLFQRFQREMKGSVLYNLYGTSEVWDATWYDPGAAVQEIGRVPIGHPIWNTEAYLLDRHLEPVPLGTTAELYIGGEGLARGYLHRPELTAERFIPHPFSAQPGQRLYRTGDLARRRADGAIEYVGRADQQVKLRGYRIELGEVEAVLREHGLVKEAVVEVREREGEKRLVAYVVAKDGEEELVTEELRGWLGKQLPDYMVPSAFVLLESLPLTASGKINRRALPAPDQSRPELARAYVAPRTPIEQDVAQLYGEVLGVKQVGVYDNFFTELGGHSLLAMQLMSRVRDHFKLELPLRLFFESPSVGTLAETIGTLGKEVDRSKAQPIIALPRSRYRVKLSADGMPVPLEG